MCKPDISDAERDLELMLGKALLREAREHRRRRDNSLWRRFRMWAFGY